MPTKPIRLPPVSSFDDQPYTKRLTALRQQLASRGLSALLLNPGPTLHYVTGLDFHLMERPVLLAIRSEGPPRLLLPELEVLKLDSAPYAIEAEAYGEDPKGWPAALARVLDGIEGRVGAEPRGLRLLETRLIEQAKSGIELVPADELVADVRGRKDAREIATMRRAVEIAEEAVEKTLAEIREGMTEQALAEALVLNLLRAGSSLDLPFAPIVSFGENSANPHASPTSRALRTGDLILIDWGARYEGYVSDLTRVFAFGEVPEELQEIARLVEKANLAAQAAARPGVEAGAVDRAARDTITEAGYGPLFRHRTGHGLGMEAHEEPYMRGDNTQPLEPGHAFTIEPGVYKSGLGGVRIEDDVVVTDTGIDVLSTLPRGLRSVG